MTSPASAEDLTRRSLRTLTDAEITVGTVLLEDAWNIIRTQVPGVQSRITEPGVQDLVVQIQCAMVLRVLNNPSGALEKSKSIDDFTETVRLDATVSTGALYLSDAEAELLSAGDEESDTAFTISPAGAREKGHWVSTDRWVPE